jgi:hypothetical protein
MLSKMSIFKLQFCTQGQCLLEFNNEYFVLYFSSNIAFQMPIYVFLVT